MGLFIFQGGEMRNVAFMIDGQFMLNRILALNAFHYDGPGIRAYCLNHIELDERLYRIYYYDSDCLDQKGVNPISGNTIDFLNDSAGRQRQKLYESIKTTPSFAFRKGHSVWRKDKGKLSWVLKGERLTDLLKGKIKVTDLNDRDIKPEINQKMVDMKIGIDISLIAQKRHADKLVIITGDVDFVPALKFARREGMQVVLDHLKNNVSPDLLEHVDETKTFV